MSHSAVTPGAPTPSASGSGGTSLAKTSDGPPTAVQKLAVEALGTAVLVLLGCGVAVTTGGDLVATGFAFGLTLAFLIFAFGRVSGGHFNPAVSVGAALGGRISWKEAGTYAGAQVAGGIIGAIVLMILLLGVDGFEVFNDNFPLGANGYDAGPFDYAAWAAPLVELVATAIFVMVILAVTDTRNEHPVMAPLAIGLTLVVIHFALIPLTGTSVNPARTIGPNLLSGGDWIIQIWPFIIGPLLGGALAGLAYPALFGRDSEPVPGSGLNFASKPAAAYGAPDQYQQQWNQAPAGYADAGYQAQPQPSAYAPPAAGQAAAATPQAEQPIIQDGWQWDPQAQQWIPAQQQPPANPQSGWAAPGASEQTQVRPPDGS